jgi:hypothetical protein
VKGKYFQPITSIAPKLTTTTEIDVDSIKIGLFNEISKFHGLKKPKEPNLAVLSKINVLLISLGDIDKAGIPKFFVI